MTATTKRKQTARQSGARKKETQGSGVQGQKSAVIVLRQAEGSATPPCHFGPRLRLQHLANVCKLRFDILRSYFDMPRDLSSVIVHALCAQGLLCASIVSYPDPPPKRKEGSGEYSTSPHHGLAVCYGFCLLLSLWSCLPGFSKLEVW